METAITFMRDQSPLPKAAPTASVSAWSQIGFSDFKKIWGPRYQAIPEANAPHRAPHGTGPAGRIRHWNQIAINACGLDHTPVAPGEKRIFGEQFGPTRASRAMPIIHIAIFDAVSAIDGHFKTYTGLGRAPADTSMECAVAQAACETLDALFPSQKPT